MLGLLWSQDDLRTVVKQAVAETHTEIEQEIKARLSKFRKVGDLEEQVNLLREQIETLKIEKGRKEEEFARREREVEHKVGLERKRVDFEIDQAKRETTVDLREQNLAADRKRFEEQIKFHGDRFKEEVQYLRDLMEKVLKRLPSAEIIATIGNKEARSERAASDASAAT